MNWPFLLLHSYLDKQSFIKRLVIKRFSGCSDDVKAKLFKSYCSSFYCLNLWSNFNVSTYMKVKGSYNKMFRKFLCVNREDMSTCMLLHNVKSSGEIERKLIYSFKCRLLNCDNTIIQTICDSLFYLNCDLTKYWNKKLYSSH